MRIVNSIPRRYFTKEGAGRGGRGKKLHARFVPSDVDAVIYPQSEFIQHFSVASLSPSSPEKSIYALRENEKFGLRLAAFIWNSMLQLSRVNASFSMLEILDKTTHVSFRINFQRERKLKSITSFTFSRDTFVRVQWNYAVTSEWRFEFISISCETRKVLISPNAERTQIM